MTNQAPQSPPASGLGQVLSLASLVPRWLVVAGGLLMVTWAAFEMYVGGQSQLLDLQRKRCETVAMMGGASADKNPECDADVLWPDRARAVTPAGGNDPRKNPALEAALSYHGRQMDFGLMLLVVLVSLSPGLSRAWVRVLWGGGIAFAVVASLAATWDIAALFAGLTLAASAALYGLERLANKRRSI